MSSDAGDVAKLVVLGLIVVNCCTGAALLTGTLAGVRGFGAGFGKHSILLAMAGTVLAGATVTIATWWCAVGDLCPETATGDDSRR